VWKWSIGEQQEREGGGSQENAPVSGQLRAKVHRGYTAHRLRGGGCRDVWPQHKNKNPERGEKRRLLGKKKETSFEQTETQSEREKNGASGA